MFLISFMLIFTPPIRYSLFKRIFSSFSFYDKRNSFPVFFEWLNIMKLFIPDFFLSGLLGYVSSKFNFNYLFSNSNINWDEFMSAG